MCISLLNQLAAKGTRGNAKGGVANDSPSVKIASAVLSGLKPAIQLQAGFSRVQLLPTLMTPGFLCTIVSHPDDVIKTRMQAHPNALSCPKLHSGLRSICCTFLKQTLHSLTMPRFS
jgi:hypothetical protein